MSSQIFKRGQVTSALWQILTNLGGEPTSVFSSRIKRLLDIDRTSDGVRTTGLEPDQYAFGTYPDQGKGFETEFSIFDAFCLGIAMDMLSAGFNAQEIVYLFRHIKADIRGAFDIALANPPVHRTTLYPKDRPHAPTYRRKGKLVADCRVFALIQRIELPENFRDARGRHSGGPTFTPPQFLRGLNALNESIDDLTDYDRYLYIQEVAVLAARLEEILPSIAEIKRGRK
jgi:hypothetical protein